LITSYKIQLSSLAMWQEGAILTPAENYQFVEDPQSPLLETCSCLVENFNFLPPATTPLIIVYCD